MCKKPLNILTKLHSRHLLTFVLLLTTSAFAKRRNVNRGSEYSLKYECQKLDFQEDFDMTRYTGMWYEVLSFPFCLTARAKCVVYSYAFGASQNIPIYSKFVNSQGFENKIIGMAAEKSPGILAVMFSAAREFS